MTAEPLTPNSASTSADSIAPSSERGLLIAMLILVLLGTAAMLFMV